MKLSLSTLVLVGGVALGAHAESLQPPQNIAAEPSSPRSNQMSTEAARAEMKADPQAALKYANKGIAADPRDPWPYYNKAEALARVGQTDAAVTAYNEAQQHFAANDRWGKSVAVFGRAHVLAEAKRCREARAAFDEYTALVKDKDPKAAQIAQGQAADCKADAPSSSR